MIFDRTHSSTRHAHAAIHKHLQKNKCPISHLFTRVSVFTALRAKSSILQVEACCRDERAKRACLRFIAELTEGTTDSIKEEKRSAACLQIGPIFTDVLSEWVRRGGGEGRGGGGHC